MKASKVTLYNAIQELVVHSKDELSKIINVTLVETYFHIGRIIIEYKQQVTTRASYAKKKMVVTSNKLTNKFGKCFSIDNLENMRKVYLCYKDEYNTFTEKNTIGIILCKNKKESLIKYTLGKENKQILKLLNSYKSK